MTATNVAVTATNLGEDLSFISNLDRRIHLMDLRDLVSADPPPHDRFKRELEQQLATADVLIVGFPVPERLIDRAPNLRWVHHTQAGASNLMDTDLWRSAVALTTSRGVVGRTAIAEYVLAGAAYFARGLNQGVQQRESGAFDRAGYRMRSLREATMGIIGLGGIGQEVARLANAVGMRVVATRRTAGRPLANPADVDLVLGPEGLHRVAAQSDFLVIASQLTSETMGMVDHQVFDVMRPGAVLINIARGEQVVEDDLVDALTEGRLGGAVLDVLAGEFEGRQPPRQLLDLPQVLCTPHISTLGDAPAAAQEIRRILSENIGRFMVREPLVNLVDRARGY